MTEEDQLVRLLASVLASGREGSLPQRLCSRAMEVLGMDGLVVTVLSTPDHRHVVCASDDDVVQADDVQFTLGDGPVIEAYRDGRPVLVPDLRVEEPSRWPLYGQASARSLRYAGVFAFPLQAEDHATLGVMGLYRRHAGELDERATAEARLIAGAIALSLLRTPDPVPEDPEGRGALLGAQTGDRLADVAEDQELLSRWSGSEQVVYQAVGMVVAQLRLAPFEALARLRAHAFADDLTLDEVALAVVERSLRLEG